MDLTRIQFVKSLVKSRYPQTIISVFLLAGFVLAIMAGFIGTPVGSQNFSIVFVWIAWWAILILVAVPFFGRGWCAVCPIPLAGDWLQRGAIIDPAAKKPNWLGWRVPKFLRNMWTQNITFSLVVLFSATILTNPRTTAIVLAAMLFMAIGLAMVFERRSFCRYLCPVGGFIGLYSKLAPFELRVKQKNICAGCHGKPCYNGSTDGAGCPWDVFPGGLVANTYCGLCFECIRTCPHDNIAFSVRPFSVEAATPTAKLDEAFKAFIMVGSAISYAIVLMGTNGMIKLAAYQVFSKGWFLYALLLVGTNFVGLPFLFWLFVRFGRSQRALNAKQFAMASSALIPLGLLLWVAFSLSFVLANATYIMVALSDPFGWGWNLFGTAGMDWQPLGSAYVGILQAGVLVAGLAWSAFVAQKTADQSKVPAWRVILFCLAVTMVMMWLLL